MQRRMLHVARRMLHVATWRTACHMAWPMFYGAAAGLTELVQQQPHELRLPLQRRHVRATHLPAITITLATAPGLGSPLDLGRVHAARQPR